MGRKPKPYRDKSKKTWYATIDGEKYRLGKTQEEARARFAELSKAAREQRATIDTASDDVLVATVLNTWIGWCKDGHRAESTWKRYVEFVTDFLNFKDKNGNVVCANLPVLKLNADIMEQWLDSHKEGGLKACVKDGPKTQPTKPWSSTTGCNAIGAIKAGLNWAAEETRKHIAYNPISKFPKPKPNKPKDAIEEDCYDELVKIIQKHCRNQNFLDLIDFCHDSGCRPWEAKWLQPHHCSLRDKRAIIPAREAKGREEDRVLNFGSERALEIVKKGMQREWIFLNSKGRVWSANAVSQAFRRAAKWGGPKIRQYALRHSFGTRAVEKKIDVHVIATAMGHKGIRMVHDTYSNIAYRKDFMQEQINVINDK